MPTPTTSKRPWIPAPGCVQLEMVYSSLGQICENSYHFLQGDGATEATDAQLHAIINAADAWERNNAAPLRNTSTILSKMRARQLGVQGGLAIEVDPVNPVVGTQINAMPNNVTAAITYRTARSGRSYRGRSYWIGLGKAQTVDNTLALSARDAIQAAANAFRTQLEAVAGVQFVVLSYAANKFWRDAGVPTHIVNVSVDVNLDSQRRRLAGRGT